MYKIFWLEFVSDLDEMLIYASMEETANTATLILVKQTNNRLLVPHDTLHTCSNKFSMNVGDGFHTGGLTIAHNGCPMMAQYRAN